MTKKSKSTVAMMRDKFFNDSRPAVHMGLPKLKLKKGVKIITLPFTVAMSEAYVRACDPKILRAWEDCNDVSREIDQVNMRVRVPNTNVAFYELIDLADPLYRLLNVELEHFIMQRVATEIFLTFSIELKLLQFEKLGHFALERSATTLYAEFTPSQFALGGGMAEAVAAVVAPVANPNSGISSMSISMPGGPSVTIDKAAAQRMQKNTGGETRA